jgi:hypothetical protein
MTRYLKNEQSEEMLMHSANYVLTWFADEAGPCKACTGQTGRGILGAVEIEQEVWPLCDNCLMELAPNLAIAMIAVQVVRELGALARDRVPPDAIVVFLTFATLADRACDWPRRMCFLRDLEEVEVEDELEDGAN